MVVEGRAMRRNRMPFMAPCSTLLSLKAKIVPANHVILIIPAVKVAHRTAPVYQGVSFANYVMEGRKTAWFFLLPASWLRWRRRSLSL